MAYSERDSNQPFNICPLCRLKVGVLGTTVTAIMKVTTKVTICLNVNKMVSTATMAEYKQKAAHSTPAIITVTSTIGQAVKPSQSKVATQSMEL